MGYAFRQRDEELEPEPSGRRSGEPPRRAIGYGVLGPPGRIPQLIRLSAMAVLALLAVGIVAALISLAL